MYQIKSPDDPYSQLIANAVLREFPSQCKAGSLALLEMITSEIMGSKKERYGPKPSPESLVLIRDAVRDHLDRHRPIPFLVPWGSEKPDGSGVDIAELGALKMLRCLNNRVRQHYMPGLDFNIRVEDVSAPHLFYDRAEQAREDARHYSDGFEALVSALGLSDFIHVVRESHLITEELFNQDADLILPHMEDYLLGSSSQSHAELQALGWKGQVSQDTRQFYLTRYEGLYPKDDPEQRVHRLARYLSASLARKRLGITGANPDWGGCYIELAFFPSPPGSQGYFGRRVYYRTLPSVITANHMPPWRSKGYMAITDENDVYLKLTSFLHQKAYNTHVVTLINGDISAPVQADYILI